MKKCTQCGQTLSDETKFCYKCGGSDFENAAESGGGQQPAQPAYQQPTYQQPVYQQPAYQQPAQPAYYQKPVTGSSETVSVGMNFLFLFLASIPLVNIIFAIVIAASSQKRSYKNLGLAWLIYLAVQIVFGIIIFFAVRQLVIEIIDEIFYNLNYLY